MSKTAAVLEEHRTLDHLLTGARRLFAQAPAVSRHLARNFFDHVLRQQLDVSPAVRRKLCTSCGSIAVAGLTCQMSTVDVGMRKRRSRGAASRASKRAKANASEAEAAGPGDAPVGKAAPAEQQQQHRKQFRVPARPIVFQHPEHGVPGKMLATNIKSRCLVCEHVVYLPGMSLDDVAAAEAATPLVSVPRPIAPPTKRAASAAVASPADSADATTKKRKLDSGSSASFTPKAATAPKAVAASALPPSRLNQGKPAAAMAASASAASAKPQAKKKDAKKRNNLQGILKKQQEDKERQAESGSGYNLMDFLSTL
ncbi:hypothetical protein BC831DRAFT_516330 [Entophlyctis helioformis]|nr:hypothetical protein BC831DRAFT_516330 [Entophlyctis helioformis]